MFFSLLSRINLTSMHVVLTEDLHLSEYQYGGALGAFCIFYELSSVLIMLFILTYYTH